jgi:hypothetical protein
LVDAVLFWFCTSEKETLLVRCGCYKGVEYGGREEGGRHSLVSEDRRGIPAASIIIAARPEDMATP